MMMQESTSDDSQDSSIKHEELDEEGDEYDDLTSQVELEMPSDYIVKVENMSETSEDEDETDTQECEDYIVHDTSTGNLILHNTNENSGDDMETCGDDYVTHGDSSYFTIETENTDASSEETDTECSTSDAILTDNVKPEISVARTTVEKCKTRRKQIKHDSQRLPEKKRKKQKGTDAITERKQRQESRQLLKKKHFVPNKTVHPTRQVQSRAKILQTIQQKQQRMLHQRTHSRSNQKVSTEEFINLIRDAPALWQKSHPDFCQREIRHKLLNQIAAAAKMDAAECAKRLKSIKDGMRLQVAKLPKTSSGIPVFSDNDHITWPFFNQLLFMKEEFVGRKITSSTGLGETPFINESDYYSIQEAEELSIRASSLSPSELSDCEQPSSTPTYYEGRQKKLLQKFFRTDELDVFMSDISNDLRKIKCPSKLTRVKAKIRRITEAFVMSELLPL